ncbi:18886_t:CDS:1, partial [Gigaspora margarita]
GNSNKNCGHYCKTIQQYINEHTYAGSYIRTTDNIVVFYITPRTPIETILNLPAVIPIRHLLNFDIAAQNGLSLISLRYRKEQICEIAREHNPVLLLSSLM